MDISSLLSSDYFLPTIGGLVAVIIFIGIVKLFSKKDVVPAPVVQGESAQAQPQVQPQAQTPPQPQATAPVEVNITAPSSSVETKEASTPTLAPNSTPEAGEPAPQETHLSNDVAQAPSVESAPTSLGEATGAPVAKQGEVPPISSWKPSEHAAPLNVEETENQTENQNKEQPTQ